MTILITPEWDLPDRLVKARTVAKLSQGDLAHRLGVSEITVRRYEAGTHVPKRGTLLGWAVACGVDPRWLEGVTAESGDMSITHWYSAA